jgi:threonine/homoserine/homoserine lactone efflux protein
MTIMNSISTFLLAFGLSIGAVVSPGPVSAAIISEAPMRGWLVGPLIAAGHTALELIMVILLSMGLNADLVSPGIEDGIAVGGGLVLIGMGLSYFIGLQRNAFNLSSTTVDPAGRTPLSLIGLGVLTTISNPFWFTWWLTVAAGFLTQMGRLDMLELSLFYVGHISADYAWDTALSLSASLGSRWLNDRLYRLLILITAGFMLYIGVTFILNGIR